MPVRSFVYLSIMLLVITASIVANAKDSYPRITLEEAREAGQQVLTGPLAGTILVPVVKQLLPGFYVFEVQSSNPVASPHVASFAVNSLTGDVWDLAGFCAHLTSPALRKVQSDIRKRFKFTPQEYKELRAQKPMCDAG